MVFFTRKDKSQCLRPLKYLKLRHNTRFLGLVWERKLSWKINIDERARKPSTALYNCNKVERKWNLTYMTYTAVVRPILIYWSLVWWDSIERKSNHRLVQRLQWSTWIVKLSNSQATMRAIRFELLISGTVYKSQRYLNALTERFSGRFILEALHNDISGNFRADEPSRLGITIQLWDEFAIQPGEPMIKLLTWL